MEYNKIYIYGNSYYSQYLLYSYTILLLRIDTSATFVLY